MINNNEVVSMYVCVYVCMYIGSWVKVIESRIVFWKKNSSPSTRSLRIGD